MKCHYVNSIIPNHFPIIQFPGDAEIEEAAIRPKVYFHMKQPRVVVELFQNAGFDISDDPEEFNICFGEPYGMSFYKSLTSGQLFSEFPGCNAIARKSTFCELIHKASEFNSLFSEIAPTSWKVPDENIEFFSEFQQDKFYIYKPSVGSEGRGIKIFDSSLSKNINFEDKAVIEEYIDDVLLINNTKFDLRLYVLLTSVEPLIFYLYEDGLVRFASKQHEKISESNCSEVKMHLTNFSINYAKNEQNIKWKFTEFLEYFDENQLVPNMSSGELLDSIRNVIKLAMIATEPRYHEFTERSGLLFTYPRRCFGLYGVDILLESNGSPKILEINKCPNKETKTQVDIDVKTGLLRDTMNLIGYGPPIDDSGNVIELSCADEANAEPLDAGTNSAHEEDYSFVNYEELDSSDVSAKGLTNLEKRAILQLLDEESRIGEYYRIFPDGVLESRELFKEKRKLNDLLLWAIKNLTIREQLYE